MKLERKGKNMMKYIRIFGLIILICLVWGLNSAYGGGKKDKPKTDDTPATEVSKTEQEQSNIDTTDENNETVFSESKGEVPTEKEDIKEDVKTDTGNNKKVEKSVSKSNVDTTTPKTETTSKVETDTTQNATPSEEAKTTETTDIPVWEQLGMTEEHYNNEPMYSWEHVDFSISKYGTIKACYDACIEYGDKYEDYLNGKVLYECSEVTSTSGKTLGVMFSTRNVS